MIVINVVPRKTCPQCSTRKLAGAFYLRREGWKPLNSGIFFQTTLDPRCLGSWCKECCKIRNRQSKWKSKGQTGWKIIPSPPVEDGFKFCRSCLTPKTKENFNKQGKNKDGSHYTQPMCRDCSKKSYKIYHISKYNLTQADVERMFAAQNYRCAICKTDSPTSGMWCIDHDHACCPTRARSCGKCVRGILCNICNRVLGLFRDDIPRFGEAATYLKERRYVPRLLRDQQ